LASLITVIEIGKTMRLEYEPYWQAVCEALDLPATARVNHLAGVLLHIGV
jgi:hypothetical protein